MTHADAVHGHDVFYSCPDVRRSLRLSAIIVQSAHLKLDVVLKFMRSMKHNVACNELMRLLKLHSL